MTRHSILDTFPAFNQFWQRARSLPIDQAIESWRGDYLRPWPELRRKQIANYREDGVDWRRVARTRIFPSFDERLPRMRKVRSHLLQAIPTAVRRCRSQLDLDFPVTFVVHVGIGCGAGWATTFGGRPAVLFGVENAEEVGWTDRATLVALVEHEIAHLVHERWRRQARVGPLASRRGPWWQLYEEGFATRCELELGGIGSHHATERTQDWLAWCGRNRARLAALFLRTTAACRPTRRFFGSWYNIDGYINTGYYLGSEAIRHAEARASLREIACWNPTQVPGRMRASLRQMVAERCAVL